MVRTGDLKNINSLNLKNVKMHFLPNFKNIFKVPGVMNDITIDGCMWIVLYFFFLSVYNQRAVGDLGHM